MDSLLIVRGGGEPLGDVEGQTGIPFDHDMVLFLLVLRIGDLGTQRV